MLAPLLDGFMIRRFRRLYSRESGFVSPLAGYEGLVAEMHHALATFSRDKRLELDAIVLPRVLGGPFAPFVRALARRRPQLFRALFVRLTPTGLHYLIGPSERVSPSEIEIPRCRFLREGGARLCIDVCKLPSEHFFEQEYRVRLRFAPDLERGRCRMSID